MFDAMMRTLTRLIGGRDIEKMKTHEAQKIVSDFYLDIELHSIGKSQKDLQKIEFLSQKALKNIGLEFFA